MAKVVKNSNAGWIIMHNGDGDIPEVKEFFEKAVRESESLGINKNQLCLDMGIGFGKNKAAGYEPYFKCFKVQIKRISSSFGNKQKACYKKKEQARKILKCVSTAI